MYENLTAKLITLLESEHRPYGEAVNAIVGVLKYVNAKGDGYLKQSEICDVLKGVHHGKEEHLEEQPSGGGTAQN